MTTLKITTFQTCPVRYGVAKGGNPKASAFAGGHVWKDASWLTAHEAALRALESDQAVASHSVRLGWMESKQFVGAAVEPLAELCELRGRGLRAANLPTGDRTLSDVAVVRCKAFAELLLRQAARFSHHG